MSGFAPAQIKKLVRSLDPAKVRVREAEGKPLRYIEGWFAIQEANAIFGFAGWDRQMVHCEKLYERLKAGEHHCAYLARVKITVWAAGHPVTREGTGFGTACEPDLAQAHERALKSAETDATKRALATFGNRFGLSLYDKEQNGTPPSAQRFALRGSDGALIAQAVSPEGFCSGLRQLVEASTSANDLIALRVHNQERIEALRRQAPGLKSSRGIHYADILHSLIAKRLVAFGINSSDDMNKVTSVPDNPAPAHDQSLASVDDKSRSPRSTVPANRQELDSSTETQRSVVPANQDEPTVPPTSAPMKSERDGSPISPAKPDLVCLKRPAATTRPSRIGAGQAIEKSQLQLASDRRIRNKAHLALVASKPCLICEDIPCHAHHLTFAQRRGLSQKVSDEFTVPLCALHHNAVHLSGSERAWWRAQAIAPLETAAKLWAETLASALSAE